MSEKNSEARRKYWSSMTPAQRTERMRDIAKKKQKKLTFAQRRAHALRMVAARQKIKVIK